MAATDKKIDQNTTFWACGTEAEHMSVTRIIIRHDIDTIRCINNVDSLLSIYADFSIHASFFVNMGKAVSRLEAIRSILSRKGMDNIVKLPNIEKLGLRDYLYTAFVNPYVGLSRPDVLNRIESLGHELGLHGGRNHALWQRDAHCWSEERIREELDWGIGVFTQSVSHSPVIFSSPGWNGSSGIDALLKEYGFKLVADLHNKGGCVIDRGNVDGLCRVSTNLLGEPGGVGFFESCIAGGMGGEGVIDLLNSELARGAVNVLYDHPGLMSRNVDLLSEVIKFLLLEGVEFITYRDVCERSANG